jgi:nucleoside 2-deoxyribosyltransferase
MQVYLAGPEVFHRDANRLGNRKKALCADYGFVGLYPLDHEIAPGLLAPSPAIYAGCVAMICAADCGIFNLTPFRGPSADVGTAMELGLMVARGKPVFAYTNVADDLIGRLRRDPGLTFDRDTGVWRDPQGMMAEDFGNADNLMLDEALAAQGRNIHRRAVAEADHFEDLGGFIACLEDARRLYASR